MYVLTASYARPEDPERFMTHFREVHTPIVRRFPGLRHLSWSLCESADGTPPPHQLIARVGFADRDSALEALASPVGAEAVKDLENFATAGVQIDLGEEVVEL
ncbi:EthD family reductase [Pseudonocardia kujensis]|uniref:EthD family reductase n=1 Tax=Pseudonocardia kujensis TaxID=1128675 RepID=UPI001E29BDAA|nr:EthD family reductase [Pseudonocardia kujensis]MCE0764096.1 EthD family reductase [Pseudonocardia kujensis]